MAMSGRERQRRYLEKRPPIKPEQQDIEAIEREYGPLPTDATIEEQAERWKLCQTQAVIRLARSDPKIAAILKSSGLE
jgi:hypothetical protein